MNSFLSVVLPKQFNKFSKDKSCIEVTIDNLEQCDAIGDTRMSTAIDISAVDLSHFFRTWITRIMYMTLNSPSWIVSVFAYRNDQY